MELWVRMRTKQAMNRQPKKLAQKPVLKVNLENVTDHYNPAEDYPH